MNSLLTHPGLVLIGAAALLAALRGTPRAAVALAAPLLSLALVWQTGDGVHWSAEFLGYELAPFAADPLSRLFALIFALMAFGGALFALNQTSRLELPAAFLYAGSAIGVTFAGDLVTLVVFWELMAIGSTLVLWSAATPASYRASLRYLMVHLLGGMLLIIGVAGHILQTGSVEFSAMQPDGFARALILAGFLVNAGAPPLSAWLPDAYPEASWSGMVFLSAFTTKSAVYALIRGFPGTELLVYVGLFMVFYGIVYALLENDMRRILAYSIVSQVGLMVASAGLGTEMALNGAALHAFTHILYKALLLMSAGSVLFATGRRKCTELGGLFRTMPLTTACGIVGALTFSSFPLTLGFASKSIISQAAGDNHLFTVWMLLAAVPAWVFPWFVFFQKDSGLRPPEPPWNMRLAMLLFAALCIGLGIWYEPLYRLLPYPANYEPYTGFHVVAQLQLLLFSGLAFFTMLGWLRRTPTITLDFDWFYRVPFLRLARTAAAKCAASIAGAERAAARGWSWLEAKAFALHGPQSMLARTWPSSAMALGVMLMLLALLVSYYAS